MAKRPKLFISYSSADRQHAEHLVSALLLNSVQVWFDRFDIDVGQNIHERIHAGVVEIDFLGIILTHHSLESAWVKEELSLAKQRELEERRVIVLPLLFERVALPLSLRARKYADFVDFDSGFRELMRVLDRRAVLAPLDVSLRLRIRDTVFDVGSRSASHVQAIRSQSAERIVRGTALPLTNVAQQLTLDSGDDGLSPATITVDLQSAEAEIPIRVDLSERCGSVLARVLQAIGLDGLVRERQRFSFFLIYDGIPLELDERLRDADVRNGAHLQLGAFTYLIE